MTRTLFQFVFGIFGAVLFPFIACAEQPQSSPAEIVASHSPRQLIGVASKIAATATTPRDYSEMIYYLDKATSSRAIVPEHRQYARKLKGWAHNRLGEHFAAQGKEAAAMTQFETAVELNFKHWKALHNRGVSYAMSDRLDEAAQDFSATIRIHPEYANAWFNRGVSYAMSDRLDAAAQDFSATIRIHPEYANAWFNRAEVFMKQGKTDLAIENYSQAITLDAEDPGFYAGRGKAYRLQGKYFQAETDLDRALELDGRLTEGYIQRGHLWQDQGAYEKAAADYRAAVRNDSRSVAAFRSVAWMMATCEDQRFRDPKRAIQFAQKAIELNDGEDFRLLDTMAAAHANVGQYSHAVTEQQRAIEMATGQATGREMYALKQRLQQYSQQTPHRTEVIARQTDSSGRFQ